VKNLLITAGGTATSWHIVKIAKEYFSDKFKIYVCDTNESYLVPASSLADKYFKVPPVIDSQYRSVMLNLLKSENIEVFIPIVDQEIYEFPVDSEEIKDLGISVIGLSKKSIMILRNKKIISDYLNKNSISTPKTYEKNDVLDNEKKYVVKPILGFGSKGVEILNGDIMSKKELKDDVLIQEVCNPPEVTVDVFNNNNDIRIACRERLEVKAGVCTKARIFKDEKIEKLTKQICEAIDMPIAFCYQIMKDNDDNWSVTDLNPRIGAGTALSSACDWTLAAAILTFYSGGNKPQQYLNNISKDKYVVRIYDEILM